MNLEHKKDKRGRSLRRIAGLLCVLLAAAGPLSAKAQDVITQELGSVGSVRQNAGTLTLRVSEGKLMTLPAPAHQIFVADPTIANVQVPDVHHIFVFGKRAGRTTLDVLGANGATLRSLTIDVRNQTAPIQQLIEATPAGQKIDVGDAANGISLTGSAPTPAAAAAASRIAAENAPDKATIDDRIKVRGSVQVNLRVRIAEVSRTITKQLGINWNALMRVGSFQYGLFTGRTLFSGGALSGFNSFLPATPLQGAGQPGSIIGGFNTSGGGINGVIDALAEEGLVTILAEPNLTAISGETASFLAGGEFPIPVSQALGVTTIEFKSYGVSLSFVPTVMSGSHISLHVKPEVSEISSQGAITVSGLSIPALTVRRADTTIELGSGQSFAIAGLLQNNDSSDIQRFPGLGDLPVLGALFRSTSFQRNESELLIIVTPYIVQPIDDPKAVRLPTDAWHPATDIERVFKGLVASSHPEGKGAGQAEAARPLHLLGAAGFEIE